MHEVGHLVRAHAERADALDADHDHERWNVADAAINDDLVVAGVPLPAGVVSRLQAAPNSDDGPC